MFMIPRLTIEARRVVAGDCADALAYGLRTYVDEMDDWVNKAYAAWPTQLYLVGLDGRIVYKGGPGPYDANAAATRSSLTRASSATGSRAGFFTNPSIDKGSMIFTKLPLSVS